MSTSGIATIDPKTQGGEVDKLSSLIPELRVDGRKKFLNDVPSAEYTFDTSQPDKLETEICRQRGQERKYTILLGTS